MTPVLQRSKALLAGIPRTELYLLVFAMAMAVGLVVIYVLATHPNALAGDQAEYHQEGIFFTNGKFLWSIEPFGVPHASAWKAPLYGAWVGVWYAVMGDNPTALTLVQSLLAAATVGVTWALARSLFGPLAAIVSALIVATFPLVWEWFGLVYTEALAIPLTVLVLYLFLTREPSRLLALAVGLLMGASLLLRPTSMFLFAGIAAAWWVRSGWRQSLALTALCGAASILVVLPWTVRNYAVSDGFIPISIQDASAYGTFSELSANHPVNPYSWQPITPESEDLLDGPPVDDAELRSQMSELARDYIEEHPLSVAEAFFWNGLSRFWDIRRPGRALDEVDFEGRSEVVTAVGLAIYYLLLPLALLGLWRHRHRRALVVPVLATAVAASLVFTVASGTRYRAPLEPLIVVLAVAAFRQPNAAATPRREPVPGNALS